MKNPKRSGKLRKLRIALALLLCLSCMLAAAACNTNDEDTPNDANNQDKNETGETVETGDPVKPRLPDVNMNGRKFTFATMGWADDTDYGFPVDFAPHEYTNDPVNDASYERKLLIEQTYNCELIQLIPADTVVAFTNSVLADDKAYDVGRLRGPHLANLITSNCLTEWSDLTYVDMDKPYWNKNYYDSMALLGRHFGAIGDAQRCSYASTFIMCFNKDIIKDRELESPYDLVKTGKWTYDKMHEMARDIGQDLNSDGKMGQEDMWGINYDGDTIMGLINSVGVRAAILDSDGVPQLTIGDETSLMKLDRIYTEMRNINYSVDTLFYNWWLMNPTTIFGEGRCLFLLVSTNRVKELRALDLDFGIIPYPKWDEKDDYTPAAPGSYYPTIVVAQTVTDLDNLGIVLEALAYEGYKNVIPAFYDSLLKTKTARDEDSSDMIDYIFSNIQYDIGFTYNFGGIVGLFGVQMSQYQNWQIVSQIDANKHTWQKGIDDLIRDIEANYGG